MPHSKKLNASRAFEQITTPSLRKVLEAQKELLHTGKLHFVGRDEWNQEVTKTRRGFAKTKRLVRRNLQSSGPR